VFLADYHPANLLKNAKMTMMKKTVFLADSHAVNLLKNAKMNVMKKHCFFGEFSCCLPSEKCNFFAFFFLILEHFQ